MFFLGFFFLVGGGGVTQRKILLFLLCCLFRAASAGAEAALKRQHKRIYIFYREKKQQIITKIGNGKPCLQQLVWIQVTFAGDSNVYVNSLRLYVSAASFTLFQANHIYRVISTNGHLSTTATFP